MQACAVHASCQSPFIGSTRALPRQLRTSGCRATITRPKFGVFSKIDTGYKKAGGDAQKSTVEDQLHEAEANKNASNFVKEFKEDLGATGKNKSAEDKKDIQQREDDKLGLKRDEDDAKRQSQSKKE